MAEEQWNFQVLFESVQPADHRRLAETERLARTGK
jgi:hypothetical protein